VDERTSQLLHTLLTYPNAAGIHSNNDRRALLKVLLDHYRYHLEGMGEIRSLLVLEEVFRPGKA